MTHDTREVEDIVDELYSLAWQDGSEGLNRRSALNERFQSAIHHQLQKAHQDWLREEIERLVIEQPKRITEQETHHTYNDGNRDALQTIIDRYNEELDQEVNNK